MSSTVDTTRSDLRSAEEEFTRASHLVAAATGYEAQRQRGAGADPEAVVDPFGRYLNPGPGPGTSGVVQPAERRADLQFLNGDHLEHAEGTSDFFSVARAYADQQPDTAAGDTDLSTLLDDLDAFVNESGGAEAVVDTLASLLDAGGPSMAAHVAELTRLLAHTARGWRDDLVTALNNDFDDGERDAGTLAESEKGEIQSFVEGHVDCEPIDDLENEAIALLPIRLETRFVGTDREGVDAPELWVRIYPDAIHNDSHEPQLTDREVRLGRTYWAYLWLGTHRHLDSVDRSYLAATLPPDADRLVELLAAVDPASFPAAPRERKDAIKERAWKQLLEGLGRERAAYVVHELKPDGWEELADTDTVLNPVLTAEDSTVDGDAEDASDDPTRVAALRLPEPDRRPASWTRPPYARLLPDRWIAYGVWTHDSRDYTEVFVTKSNAVREPLPVGPDPEALAVAEQHGADDPGAEMASEVGDVTWLTNFGTAERYGMAFRITEEDVFAGAPDEPVDEDELKRRMHDLTDGHFEQLVVTGVKASMDPEETSRRLADLLDAHHYTEGLELVRQGTPTNNADVTAGYRSVDDPRESMAVECGTALLEHGDYSDGDKLARALGVDPGATGGGEHVFAHVENADATDQLDAWFANSALWPGTLGYYFQNMLYPNPDGSKSSLLFDPSGAEQPWIEAGQTYEEWHAERAGSFDAYRRYFVEYVRAQGPLPTFRADTQPYGVLPVTPMADDREDIFSADADEEADRSGDGVGTGRGPSLGGDGSDIPVGGLGGGTRGGDADIGWTTRESDVDWGFATWPTEGSPGEGDLNASAAWEASDPETFRRTVAPREARGAISDEELAATYAPEEAATTFTTSELATHYEPSAAARVLSADQLRAHYSEAELAESDLDVNPDAADGRGA